MQLVADAPLVAGRSVRVREDAGDDLGPSLVRPDEDVPLLAADPGRVRPAVDRLTPQVEPLGLRRVTIDRVARRVLGVEGQEPLGAEAAGSSTGPAARRSPRAGSHLAGINTPTQVLRVAPG